MILDHIMNSFVTSSCSFLADVYVHDHLYIHLHINCETKLSLVDNCFNFFLLSFKYSLYIGLDYSSSIVGERVMALSLRSEILLYLLLGRVQVEIDIDVFRRVMKYK